MMPPVNKRTNKKHGPIETPPDVQPLVRYSVTEAASKLGVHRNTITNQVNQGLLRPVNATAQRMQFQGKEILRWWRTKR